MQDDRLEKIKFFYKKWLHREADEGGAQHYYNSELSVDHIEMVIKNSPEAKAIEKKEKSGGVEFDSIEPGLLVGSAFNESNLETLVKSGISHVLEIQPSDIDYGTFFVGGMNLGLPANTVMSVSDMEKSLIFIQRFMKKRNATEKLLIAGSQGVARAPGLVALWYIANGMEEEAAVLYVESCRDGCNITAALFGPWHFEAAKKLFIGD